MTQEIQIITHQGEVAGFVTHDQLLITATLDAAATAVVEAMAVYAITILTGERPGPYTDAAALRFAQATLRSHTKGPRLCEYRSRTAPA